MCRGPRGTGEGGAQEKETDNRRQVLSRGNEENGGTLTAEGRRKFRPGEKEEG